jgi:hypothetical protein
MDKIFDKIRFNKPGCDWQITLIDPRVEGDVLVADNFVLARANGKHFHATLVEGEALGDDGKPFRFWQSMSFEHDQGRNKVGDVVLVFRKSPHGRWMVQVEQEDIYLNETTTQKIWRATRSSLDNVIQAVKRTVVEVGRGYANPRRLGGNAIAQHYVHAPWSPQLAENMMDVFNFIDTPDSLGHSVFLKALRHMPQEMADEIFHQIREPHYNGLTI